MRRGSQRREQWPDEPSAEDGKFRPVAKKVRLSRRGRTVSPIAKNSERKPSTKTDGYSPAADQTAGSQIRATVLRKMGSLAEE